MMRAILLIFLILAVSCKKQSKVDSVEENETIEVVNFSELEDLLNKRGNQLTVVNFWATWCKPCVEELPLFEEVRDSLGESDLKVVLVSLDFPDKFESQLLPFVAKHQLKSQVILLDDPHENEWIPKVDSNWSGAIPATLMLKGTERKFFEKSFTRASLFEEISELIKS